MAELEITTPVDLCLPSGRLNPAAVGWTRQPLHHANLRGWGRTKRWDYWAVQSPDWAFTVTVGHIDYLAQNVLYFADFTTGEQIVQSTLVPLARGPELPPSSGGGPVTVRTKRLSITLTPDSGGVRIEAESPRISADVYASRPQGHESLGVVVPWSSKRFQYTVKDNTLPASGSVTVDGRTLELPGGESWAVLDHGRGKWPYDRKWNWGSGAGIVEGRTVGLQFGGKWTVGTGMTENALCVDGRLTKLGDEIDWSYPDWMGPWRLTSPEVDVTFTPRLERHDKTNVGLIFVEVHQCFGTWAGRVADVEFDGIHGFAEQAHNRW